MSVSILRTTLLYSLLFSQLASARRISSSSTTPRDSFSGETSSSDAVTAAASGAGRGGFRRALTSTVIPTLCVLGAFGNLIILLVWSSASDFNATVFFMKGLAVTDTVFLAATFTDCLTDKGEKAVESAIIYGFQLYSYVVITATTLVLVFTRWVAVHRPMEVATLLPKRWVVLVYGAVHLWGVLAMSVVVSLSNGTVTVIINTVGVALPVLVTVGLNVSLVRKVCVHRANSALGQQQQQQQLSAQAARSSQLHRMVAAVVCLSVTTVLAYPVAFAAYLVHATTERPSNYLDDMVHLLIAFNSSINVVFYLAFVSHFRQLFRHRFRCLLCRQDRPYVASTVR